jgi:hypothetical protein
MNYYEILEVSQNASHEVIKAAYKSLMQRYHPDRNPGNVKVAEHASQVVQAYEVLSDIDKRAAYDIKLKQPSTDNLIVIREKRRDVRASPALADKVGKSDWFVWLVIALFLVSGWLILSPSKKNQLPGTELKEIRSSLEKNLSTQEQREAYIKHIDEIFRRHPELRKNEESDRARVVAARTIPILFTNLTVNLRVPDKSSGTSEKPPGDSAEIPEEAGKPAESPGKTPEAPEKSPVDSGHVLYIPSLGVIVGTFDPDKVIQYINTDNHRELISQKLAEKLVDAKYEELVKIDGEHYLKEMILDSICETTGTDRHKNYPSLNEKEPAHYGIVEVLLPESFSVR